MYALHAAPPPEVRVALAPTQQAQLDKLAAFTEDEAVAAARAAVCNYQVRPLCQDMWGQYDLVSFEAFVAGAAKDQFWVNLYTELLECVSYTGMVAQLLTVLDAFDKKFYLPAAAAWRAEAMSVMERGANMRQVEGLYRKLLFGGECLTFRGQKRRSHKPGPNQVLAYNTVPDPRWQDHAQHTLWQGLLEQIIDTKRALLLPGSDSGTRAGPAGAGAALPSVDMMQRGGDDALVINAARGSQARGAKRRKAGPARRRSVPGTGEVGAGRVCTPPPPAAVTPPQKPSSRSVQQPLGDDDECAVEGPPQAARARASPPAPAAAVGNGAPRRERTPPPPPKRTKSPAAEDGVLVGPRMAPAVATVNREAVAGAPSSDQSLVAVTAVTTLARADLATVSALQLVPAVPRGPRLPPPPERSLSDEQANANVAADVLKAHILCTDISRLYGDLERTPIPVLAHDPGHKLPPRFVYITKRVGVDALAPADWRATSTSCTCSGQCSGAPTRQEPNRCCHLKYRDAEYGEKDDKDYYNRPLRGRLPYLPGSHGVCILDPDSACHLHECGAFCSCDLTCPMRVLQHGITRRLALMPCGDRGWGVFAVEHIPRGAFIGEYTGRVIESDQAEDVKNDQYLFDIRSCDWQLEDQDNCLVVDAAAQGNVTRFMNHSCSPNAMVRLVRWDMHDRKFSHLAFFTKEDIAPGTELTIDYAYEIEDEGPRVPCRCGAAKCRGVLRMMRGKQTSKQLWTCRGRAGAGLGLSQG